MIPRALVTITLKQVAKIDPGLLSSAQHPYVLARIGSRLFGRSRILPRSGGTFSLTSEPVSWSDRVAATGTDIPVVAQIWDDLGDAAPTMLAEIAGTVPVPYFTLEMTIGNSPSIVLDVKTTLIPAPVAQAPVPRAAPGQSTRATLRPVNSLVVELTDIVGLRAPVAAGQGGLLRSERRVGYCSEDHAGRIYLNHDLTGAWKSKAQQIQLEARLTPVRGTIPKDAKVRWRIVDVDDPANDATGVHAQWGPYIDARDYTNGKHSGASGADKEGKPSHDPPWEEVPGFALTSKAHHDATTAVVGGASKVVLNCPSTAGDNFIVTAEAESKSKIESFGGRTGIMAMWHRLQVESIRMNSGLPLPIEDVAVPFEVAFAELEFSPDRVVADVTQMAANREVLDAACAAYVDTVFSHKSDPGWFCIIAAMEPHPLPTNVGAQLFAGRVPLKATGTGQRHVEYFEIPGSHPDADFVQLTFGADTVGFSLFGIQVLTTPAGTFTRCFIQEHDAQPDFTAGDGSIAHAYAVRYMYSPRFRKSSSGVTSGGYGMPPEVDVTVFSPGAFYTSGISPPIPRGREEYFAGRTIVFTHHGFYRDPKTGQPRSKFHGRALQVMVHELVHAFGMPHKCGYFDFRTPRVETCCMNYSPNWMVDDQRKLIPGTSGKVGMDLCGRHIKEVRRVRLQDNKGLGWT
jgi:hypothetical protein